MREIKFRAWDDKRKKMLIGDGQEEVCIVAWSGDVFPMYCSSDMDGDFYSEVNFTKELWHRDIKLMQYTGLKDKNGIEIYEGDIMKAKRHNFEDYDICVIVYRPISFVFEVQSEKGNYIAPRNWHQHFEVIGNIYENSDLLK